MNEVIKLLLDMGMSGPEAEKVAVALDKVRVAAQKAADTYEVMNAVITKSVGITGTYAISTQQSDAATEAAVRAAVERTSAERALARALEESVSAQGKAGNSSRDLSMRILNLGRAAQDLAQGGFAGIINNIEGIVGGGGIAAGVLTALGTAAFLATPYIKEWVKSLGVGGKEVIPEATDRIERMTEALKRDKEAIEEKKKAGELDYFEMQKYLNLVAKVAKEEQELATARAARSVTGADSKAGRARASAFREAVGEYGGGEKLVGALEDAGRSTKDAETLVADALQGYQSAIVGIQNILRGRGAAQIGYQSPEAKARAQRATGQTDAALKGNADRGKLNEEVRALEEEFAEGADAMGGDHPGAAARRRADREQGMFTDPARRRLRMPSAGELHRGDVETWQRTAAHVEQQVAQQGGATPQQAALLQRLSEKLGKAMPTMQEAMMMQEMAMNKAVSAVATMAQRLEAARRQLQALNKIGGQLEGSPMPTGLQR